MIALGVSGLMLGCRFGKTKGTPIRVSADYATGVEDLEPNIARDSEDAISVGQMDEWRLCSRDDGRTTYSRTSLRLPGRTCEESINQLDR
jgi:hypothetical protein